MVASNSVAVQALIVVLFSSVSLAKKHTVVASRSYAIEFSKIA